MRLSARALLVSSAVCVAGFIALLLGAYYTGAGHRLDNRAIDGFLSVQNARTTPIADSIASLCDPGSYALIAIAIVATAAFTRGARRAITAGLLLTVTAVTTQFLKPTLAAGGQRFDEHLVSWNHYIHPVILKQAFPSGHATASMSIALALIVIAPRAWRPVAAAFGALFTVAVSFSILTLGWHYPSDVVGGYLVALTWCLVLIAGMKIADERWPEPGTIRAATRKAISARDAAIGLAIAGMGALALGIGVAATRADELARFAADHTTATAAAMAICAAAAAVVAAVAMAASRRA
jgi:membrane-associated phospholipid phosphatase